MDLFIDFMAIFKRLMIILAQNKEGDQKRRSRR